MEPKSSSPHSQEPAPVPILTQINPVHVPPPPHPTSSRSTLTQSSHLHKGLPNIAFLHAFSPTSCISTYSTTQSNSTGSTKCSLWGTKWIFIYKVSRLSRFSPSTLVFPCLQHSANVPYSTSPKFWTCRKDKRTKPRNLSKSNAFSEIGQHWIKNNFHSLSSPREWQLYRMKSLYPPGHPVPDGLLRAMTKQMVCVMMLVCKELRKVSSKRPI